MTIHEAIKQADELRPNVLSIELKAAWIEALDGILALELMGLTPPTYSYPADGDRPLLMEAPYENIYVRYLCAEVDDANQETTLYQNDSVRFNEAFEAACRAYRRAHRPKGCVKFCNL